MVIPHPIYNIQLSNENIDRLKCDVAVKVNSIRRLERIQSIGDLVDVLWKRDEIRVQNIDGLFADSFSIFNGREKEIIRSFVLELDANYSDYPVAERNKEAEQSSGGQTESEEEPKKPQRVSNLSPLSAKFQRHKDDIFQLITQELGQRKFLNFARQSGMKIIDAELENIEERYRDVPSRIYRVLKMAEERNSPDEFAAVVLNCLKNAGRSDLKREIEQTYLS